MQICTVFGRLRAVARLVGLIGTKEAEQALPQVRDVQRRKRFESYSS